MTIKSEMFHRPKTYTSRLTVGSSQPMVSYTSRMQSDGFTNRFKSQVYVSIGGHYTSRVTDIVQHKKQKTHVLDFGEPKEEQFNHNKGQIPEIRRNGELLGESLDIHRSGSSVSFAKFPSYLSYLELLVEGGRVRSLPVSTTSYDPILSAPDDMIHDDPANDQELEDEEMEDDMSDLEELDDLPPVGGIARRRMSSEEEAFINMLLNVFNAADDRAKMVAMEDLTDDVQTKNMDNLVIEEVDEEEEEDVEEDKEDDSKIGDDKVTTDSETDSPEDENTNERNGMDTAEGDDETIVSPVEEEPIVCQDAKAVISLMTTSPEIEEEEVEEHDGEEASTASSSFIGSALSGTGYYYAYDESNLPISL